VLLSTPDETKARTAAVTLWIRDVCGCILCCALVLPGRTSGFRAGFRPDSGRESRPPGRPFAGRRADFKAFPIKILPKIGPETRFPARKHCRCLRNTRSSKPFEFMGLGAIDVTKPYKSIWFGDRHGPKPYEFIGFRWALISQTPVSRDITPSSWTQHRCCRAGRVLDGV
jgi:hypothetical protein